MNKRSLSVSPVIEPFAGGVIGMGIGYTLAPRKYSLKRLLLLREDKFEQIYSKELAENMSPREKLALSELKEARKLYRKVRTDVTTNVKNTALKWRKLFDKVDIPENLRTSHAESKKSLQQAIKETNYVELNKQYRAAKQALLNSPDNESLKIALNQANSNLANAKTIVGPKIEVYKSLTHDIQKERLLQIKNEPVKYLDVKEAYHNFLDALAKRRTAASNKLFELANSKSLIRCYEKLYDFLPKARTKSAATGAIILGTTTAFIMSRVNRAISKSA